MKIAFLLNGARMRLDVAADRRVVDLLREDLGLTGTKEGCGTGECGACSIMVNGESRLSCLMLASQLDGVEVITIEGLAPSAKELHPVQRSFVEHGAVQCGFCTPGMVITASAFLRHKPSSGRREKAEAISGNLCRCTGYQKILDAMEDVEDDLSSTARAILPQPVFSSASSSTAAERLVFTPASLEELWAILANHPEARLLAGGTDLLVWLRNRQIDCPALVDLRKIQALHGIGEEQGLLRIGACTTHAELQGDSRVREALPVLIQALDTLGSPHIRHLGTIGGNIVTASPAGDTLPALLVLDAEVELLSAAGNRRMPLADFLQAPGKTCLQEREILSAVLVNRPADRVLQHFEKVGLRSAMACAVASFAALISLGGDGGIRSARLAWGSVAPTAVRLPVVESALEGEPLNRETLDRVLPLIAREISPIDDVRASGAYRRLVAQNLLLRLLTVSSGCSDMEPAGKQHE